MAAGRRIAVLIASDSYSDSKLSQLKAPRPDAVKLEKILKDESIGMRYDEVNILHNKEAYVILKHLDILFTKAEKNDMILVYFAGHGHKSIHDSLLYLATCDTELDYVSSTTVPAKAINEFMQRSKSSKKILILDCCYSGAFSRGMLPRSSVEKSINLKEEFSDSGCVILTSASSMQYAWEGSELIENSDEYSSIYTKYLIEGLETGKADSDKNGEIGCIELHEYIKTRMREEGHPQTPEINMLKGDVIIAANHNWQRKSDKYSEAINSFSEYIMKKAAEYNVPKDDIKPLEDAIKEIAQVVDKISDIEKIEDIKRKDLEQAFVRIAEKELQVFPKNDVHDSFKFLLPFISITENAIQAIAWFDKALAAYLDYVDALNSKGMTFYNLKDYNQAIEWFDKALKIEPNNVLALTNKGMALNSLGQYNQAIECYDRVLYIEPNNASALTNKGMALYKLKEYNQAIEWFDKALKIEPNNVLALKYRKSAKEKVLQILFPGRSKSMRGFFSRFRGRR